MGYYDGISEGYGELYGREQLEKAKVVADLIKPKKDESLLDVGCGDGAYLYLFDCHITGIDPSKKLIKNAKGGNFVVGMAEKLPFADKSFDYVISITAVHNFDNIEAGLKEISRVARSVVVLSILKRVDSFKRTSWLIEKNFEVDKRIELNKDVVFLLRAK